jgi:flagellar hook-associated protein 3 FlgL
MTRISTLGQNQFILRQTLQTQERLLSLQRQMSTGERSEDFKGLRGDSTVLISAQARKAATEQLLANNVQTKTKLDLRERAVREIVEIAKNIKSEFLSAEGIENSSQLVIQAQIGLQQVVSILNSRDQNGNFIFAGSRTDTAPVTSVPSGAPPPAFTLTFNNDTIVEQANVDENLTISVGVLAATNPTTPTGSFQPLIDILNFFAAGVFPPPLPAEPLPAATAPTVTAAQALTLIDQAFDTVNALDASLGISQQLVDEANERLQADIDLTDEFITSLKDVDVAEVFTQLSQEQFALEASFQITGRRSDLSLIQFLRI